MNLKRSVPPEGLVRSRVVCICPLSISTTAMKITVNNHSSEFPAGTTLAQVLAALDLERPGTAVAVDKRVIKASERDSFVLYDGATVIVIGAVCGG